MALRDDLTSAVTQIFKEQWSVRDGTVVPVADRLGLGNDAVKLNATVLYADLADSTGLVDSSEPEFAAEVYKTFLHCAAKIIKEQGGDITAYDGDRIMAVFVGDVKNTAAVKAALQINYARINIIMPALRQEYPDSKYMLRHTAGIDTSSLFVAREGVRGANDLVWVGRAANHAAKLSGLSSETPTWITKAVYDAMLVEVRTQNGQALWTPYTWNAMGGRQIYASTWTWKI